MSLPYELPRHDPQLVQYLLGLLPEEEAERLDEAGIIDEEVALRLRGVEDDLIDAYVTQTLDQDTREHFEAFYLKSPHRREKVTFARRFLAAVDRAAATSTAAPAAASAAPDRVRRFSPRPDARKSSPRPSRFNWPMLTTAASLVLACGVLVKDLQLRQGLNQAQRDDTARDSRSETLIRQLNEARNENAQIAQALERARAESAAPDRPATAPLNGAGASAPVTTKAAVLFPQTRSIGDPPTVVVRAGGGGIRFELRLESNEFAQFRASLQDPATNEVMWRSSTLYARSAGSRIVAVVVPSSLLKSQHYSFELAGIDVAGHETTTANYAFRIDRR